MSKQVKQEHLESNFSGHGEKTKKTGVLYRHRDDGAKSRLKIVSIFGKSQFLTTVDNRKTRPGGGGRERVNPPPKGVRVVFF